MDKPKLLISYYHSAPEHVEKVYNLATALIDSGVDVKFFLGENTNKTDSALTLKNIVNDPEIKKILIVSDKGYENKSISCNDESSMEPDIICAEVFSNQPPGKFLAATFEKDENGKPCLPPYYNSCKYVDFCTNELYDENFKNLLNWVFDKPVSLNVKQHSPIPKDRYFLVYNEEYLYKIENDTKAGKTIASESYNEYLMKFSGNMENIRIKKPYNEIDDAVLESINNFLPFRNAFIKVLSIIAKHASDEKYIQYLHKFLETLLPYISKPENTSKYGKWESDNYIFLVHELFLYSLTILIINELFSQANYLLEQKYYIENPAGNSFYKTFSVFRKYMQSLEYRNTRLQLRSISLRAAILKERCSGIDIEFSQLMQTDFILFMRAELLTGKSWWPETLFYIGDYGKRFDLFSKISSKKYFDKVKCLLGIYSIDELKKFIKEINKNIPEWGFLN